MSRFSNLKRSSLYLVLAAAFAVTVLVAKPASPASATTEVAPTSINLTAVTLTENSNYVSAPYFGVINLTVQDNSVAYASVDSQNHVVVTAVGTGKTIVTYWYRLSASSDWVSATLPVTVSGQTSASVLVNAGTMGLVFPAMNFSLQQGSTQVIQGLKLNGFSVQASSLLWVTGDSSVISVDATTGAIQGLQKGTATLYALDPATKACGSIVVTVI